MSVSLIITVYKDYEALSLVLQSVSRQSLIPKQIIVAHDTIDIGIQPIISSYSSSLNMCHIDQVDTGFNKNRILNKAILASDHEFLIFVDGDCLLHERFIEEHRKHLVQGVFTAGRRIDLDAKTSNQVRQFGLQQLGFFRMLSNRTKRVEEAFYIKSPLVSSKKTPKLLGCNMGWCKSDLIALNGFDMDYTLPGYGEDTDLEFRALRSGMSAKTCDGKRCNTIYTTNVPTVKSTSVKAERCSKISAKLVIFTAKTVFQIWNRNFHMNNTTYLS